MSSETARQTSNAKYASRSALLQKRAGKLFSGSGELTAVVEPAMICREARHIFRTAAARQHSSKPQNGAQIIWGGGVVMIGWLLHKLPHALAICDVGSPIEIAQKNSVERFSIRLEGSILHGCREVLAALPSAVCD